MKNILKSPLFIFLSLFVFASFMQASQKIGMVVAIKDDSWIQRDGKKVDLKIKSPIYLNDKIFTDESGRVQILFDDDTSLSVGSSSSIMIDNFVFNSNKKSQFSAKVFKGISRVITGQIVEQNREGFKLQTPLTVVGIRGTILATQVDGKEEKFYLQQIKDGNIVAISHKNGNDVVLSSAGYDVVANATTLSAPKLTTKEEKEFIKESLKIATIKKDIPEDVEFEEHFDSQDDLFEEPDMNMDDDIGFDDDLNESFEMDDQDYLNESLDMDDMDDINNLMDDIDDLDDLDDDIDD